MKKFKIFFISGKRGGYDAMLPLLKLFILDKKISFKIILTDQHLKKEFGSTYAMVENQLGSRHVKKISTNQNSSKNKDRLISFSNLIFKLTDYLYKEKPDIVLIYGDRGESLISTIVCNNLEIPVCHFQGGDLSGNLDEKFRHAITKLSDLHFCSNKLSYKRIIQMGENKKFVFNIGDSHIDALRSTKIYKKDELEKKFPFIKNEKYCVLLFHPDGTSFKKNQIYIKNIIEILDKKKCRAICIYPCNDIGYEPIVKELKRVNLKGNYNVFKNLFYKDFISLIKNSEFLIGNSSSGIIETAYLNTPTINLGDRQKNRLMSNNVINSNLTKKNISISIQKARKLNSKKINFKKLYGNGFSYKKSYKIILNILKKINLNKEFNEKKI